MNKLLHHTPLPCWLLCAAALLLLWGCQADDDTARQEPTAITMDAQVEQLLTRSGQVGTIDYEKLTVTGFGVFSEGGVEGGDFENLHVEYKGITPAQLPQDLHVHPAWGYDTERLWPKDAKYSFVAYAPYVSGSLSSPGITQVNESGTSTTVEYTVANNDPAKAVDLLWGVRADTGKPWLNVKRDECCGLIVFSFRHALAGVNFRAQAMIDKDNDLLNLTDENDPNSWLGSKVKVFLKSIKLEPISPTVIYAKGTLALNNTEENKPSWTTGETTSSINLTETNIKPELTSGTGVGKAPGQEVISDGNFFMLIPNTTAGKYQLKVEYTVEYATTDGTKKLDYTESGLGAATVPLSDEKTVKEANRLTTLLPGVRYNLNLVIGLRTLSVTVDAEDWAGNPISRDILIEHGTSASSSLARQRTARP